MLPTSVIKEVRLDGPHAIAFIEVTENCDECKIVNKFATWATEHAADSPPTKLWNKNHGLPRPLFIPALVAFSRGVNGEFIFGIKCCFWNDCELNQAQRLLAVHRWLYRELNEHEKIAIPKIVENEQFDSFLQQFGGQYNPKPTGVQDE